MSNIITERWRINRRHALRGLGVSLSLPMLNCMKSLRAETVSPETLPKRSIFIYLPNGVNTLDWQITSAGEDYELSKPLAPLERHRDVMTPISGLHHPHGIGHHHGCQSIWLTGAKIGPTERNSISVDQLMTQVTAPVTRIPSLELSNTGRCLAVNPDGISLPAERKPSEAFKRLFEEPKEGIEAQRRGLHRQGSILDVVLDEARTFRGTIGTDDRMRFDQYLDSVREVEIRTERADRWLDVPRPQIESSVARRLNRDVSQQQVGDYFRTMYDITALAFETDLTRVITFSSGDEGKGLPIPEIGISQTRHGLSHHNGDPEQLRRLTESDTFNVEQLSYLLDKLKGVAESEGTLLDRTMVLFGSGMAYGHSHGNANLPLILAGGQGLGLKHGRHIDYNIGHFDGYDLSNAGYHYGICSRPKNIDARMSNLLLTMAQRMDVPVNSFADSLRPLDELMS
ncbi:DUF1552 domain-containing protein [Calycomorphotria hydatis]|uniref:DUF1552 domain-containing protein n=1 Tax=Calycomorphotria hydatis TaxID=2528027 RepID=A0A517TAT2_9PLAN|nr:DUF1552 domain-containing protein [Calycomorphotria hydatis]QDT65474.1 hypothetical protein V22_27280 [Calycomorphotria hydatis]